MAKVMFSVVSVCLSVHRGVPCDHYPWCIVPHHTFGRASEYVCPNKGTHASKEYTWSIHPVFTVQHPWTCSNLCNLDLNVQGPPNPSQNLRTESPGAPTHTQLMSIFLTNTSIFVLQNINYDDENNVSMEYNGKKLALGHVYISLFYHSF